MAQIWWWYLSGPKEEKMQERICSPFCLCFFVLLGGAGYLHPRPKASETICFQKKFRMAYNYLLKTVCD